MNQSLLKQPVAGKTMRDYQRMMDHLLALPACVITVTGRHGNDFLQSLLDSHPQVLTFNGPIHYYEFWQNSLCVAAGDFDLSDFVDEFIGKHIKSLKSRYNLLERKGQLGEEENLSIDIDLNQFKSEVMHLLEGRTVNSKNFLLAVYAAYAMCLGQDIGKKTLFFHHEHILKWMGSYLKDFPDSKIVIMTRDPRASFVSGIEHARRYDSTKDCGAHLYGYTKRLLTGANALDRYPNPYIVIRVEDLDRQDILRKLAGWLNINYDACMMKSTWGGLLWHGDQVSVNKIESQGLSRNILKNNWENKLSAKDKYIFNFILTQRLKHYHYHHRKIHILDAIVVPFLILLPLRFELRFFSLNYIRQRLQNKEFKMLAKNILFIILRTGLFFKYYWKVMRKEQFTHPLLGDD